MFSTEHGIKLKNKSATGLHQHVAIFKSNLF